MRKARLRALGTPTVLLALLAGCGGSSMVAPTPPPTPVPPPPAPRVISEGSGSLAVRFLGRVPLTVTQPGRLEVTVDWTFAQDDVDVYLVREACTFDQFVGQACQLLTFSESTTSKPEKLSVSSATAGSYTLFIGNLGPNDESLSWQVVLTPSTAATAASAGSHAVPRRLAGLQPGAIVRR